MKRYQILVFLRDSRYYSTALCTMRSTTVKRHFTPARRAIIKKQREKEAENNKCRQVCGKIGTLVHCWQECKIM